RRPPSATTRVRPPPAVTPRQARRPYASRAPPELVAPGAVAQRAAPRPLVEVRHPQELVRGGAAEARLERPALDRTVRDVGLPDPEEFPLGSHHITRRSRRVEDDAGESHDALRIRPLPVPPERAPGSPERAEQRVDRREPADPAAVAVTGDPVEEGLGVARFDRLERRPVLTAERGQISRRHGLGVAEARPDMSQIGARD